MEEIRIISEMDILEKESIEEDLLHREIDEADSDEEAMYLINEHFGTLKCKTQEYSTNKGVLWIVYPPRGVYGDVLIILIINYFSKSCLI